MDAASVPVPEDEDGLWAARLKNMEWQAFLVSRKNDNVQSRLREKKGRELNVRKLPEKVQELFEESRKKEW
eukprot:462708-Alexandrium_andersonii.AAC.1